MPRPRSSDFSSTGALDWDSPASQLRGEESPRRTSTELADRKNSSAGSVSSVASGPGSARPAGSQGGAYSSSGEQGRLGHVMSGSQMLTMVARHTSPHPQSSHTYPTSLSPSPAASPRQLSQPSGGARASASPNLAPASRTHNHTPPMQTQSRTAVSSNGNSGLGNTGQSQGWASGFNHFGQAQPSWDQGSTAAQPQSQRSPQSSASHVQANSSSPYQLPTSNNSLYPPSAARRVLDRVGTVVGSSQGAASRISPRDSGTGRR